ncbi:HPP family protein [Sulfolobales archaeon HS-7]|nr:HPP family protein [Sulfolobales archaeon HS-7]
MYTRKKALAILNLIISISILLILTILTNTEFILPPFLATSATKYPDPDWRRTRSIVIVVSYVICAVVAVCFSLFSTLLNLNSLLIATLASFVSFTITSLLDFEHPPAILATFLGVIEKVKLLYVIHPVLTGVIVVEGCNYLLSKYLERNKRKRD